VTLRRVRLRAPRLRLAKGVFFALVLSACATEDHTPPNVLLVTLDTTRVDHLSTYGYARATSPQLDRLAAEGTAHTRAVSPSSWTLPAHASLFTGKLPRSHGARYDPEGPLLLAAAIDAPEGIRARGLAPGERTLAARLRDAGYATGAVVAGPWLLEAFGLAAGFEHWDDAGIVDYAGRPAHEVVAAARRWLGTVLRSEPRRPFFLFVNLYDPHFPYDPPSAHARRFLPPGVQLDRQQRAQWPALYDAEIFAMDEQLGILLDYLRESGVWDETLVVVTSDHGELFGEHGEWGHGRFLHQPLLAIPLVVKPARGGGRASRDDERVSLHQVFGWILDATIGHDGEDPEPSETVLAEVHPMTATDSTGHWVALWDGPLKYLRASSGVERLHDLERDPSEEVDLARKRPKDLARLRTRLDRELAALPAPLPAGAEVEIDRETREALERLGYLDTP